MNVKKILLASAVAGFMATSFSVVANDLPNEEKEKPSMLERDRDAIERMADEVEEISEDKSKAADEISRLRIQSDLYENISNIAQKKKKIREALTEEPQSASVGQLPGPFGTSGQGSSLIPVLPAEQPMTDNLNPVPGLIGVTGNEGSVSGEAGSASGSQQPNNPFNLDESASNGDEIAKEEVEVEESIDDFIRVETIYRFGKKVRADISYRGGYLRVYPGKVISRDGIKIKRIGRDNLVLTWKGVEYILPVMGKDDQG